LFLGFLQSLYHIIRFRPAVIVNAGSYVGVPVIWAGWMVGIPSVLLQLDIRPSLSNVLTSFATRSIAASCEGAAKKLPRTKAVITGIPLRNAIRQARDAYRQKESHVSIRSFLGIHDERPYIVVVGGSTGAEYLNDLARSLDRLPRISYHIVLISGSRNGQGSDEQSESFHEFSFLQNEFAGVLACADVVVSRAGMGTISELAYLKKAAIIVPLPNSHQQENAAYLERVGGVINLGQEHANTDAVHRVICHLISDESSRSKLGDALSRQFFSDASERIANLLAVV
jgi:UDP-N-acetylglucosamine--N-acetylmuramyl-(pentapeptide) pyrophosphoryl-undecaprenol N-acetylglucosamine transferase